MNKYILKLRGIVEGRTEAKLLVYNKPLSFYGEVDKNTGRLIDGRQLVNRILVLKQTRGSTVAPYIIYGLAKKQKAPQAIVVTKAEPMLIVGAVLAQIPLAEGIPPGILEKLHDNCYAKITINPPSSFMKIEC